MSAADAVTPNQPSLWGQRENKMGQVLPATDGGGGSVAT